MTTNRELDRIERKLVKVLKAQAAARAAFVIGSRARAFDHPADAYSDLDVVVVTDTPDKLFTNSEWLHQLGKVLLSFSQKSAVGDLVERRILYKDWAMVDLIELPAGILSKAVQSAKISETSKTLGRGFRLLFDKDQVGVALQCLTARAGKKKAIDLEKPREAAQKFLYHALWVAQRLARGELWMAVLCLNSIMPPLLLSLIELYVRTEKGEQFDTWHAGRFLESWAPLSLRRKLPAIFASYDRASAERALGESLTLFGELASALSDLLPWDTKLFRTIVARVKGLCKCA